MQFSLPLPSTAGTAGFGAAISGCLSILGVEVSGVAQGNGPYAIGLVALASLLGGFVAALPAIIRARSEDKRITVDVHETETDKLLARIHDAHDRERLGWESERKSLDAINQRTEAVTAILRNSKHAVLNAYNLASTWIQIVQIEGGANGTKLPPFVPPDIASTLREEDEAIAKIYGVPNRATAGRRIEPATPMK